ncbi:MAG: hypothetical protein ACI8WM_002646, partial [Burkholderiaceae bacterium]
VPDFGMRVLALAEHRTKSTLAITLFFILTSLFPSGTDSCSIPRKQS